MADFTLPEELFDSMVSGFKQETSETISITIDYSAKNKIEKNNTRPVLNPVEKKRIANIAEQFFGESVKTFFFTDYSKFTKKIEEINADTVKQSVKAIQAEEEQEVKKKKKKRSINFFKLASTFRKIMALVTFVRKVVNNIKNFIQDAHNIIDKNFKGQGFTLKRRVDG